MEIDNSKEDLLKRIYVVRHAKSSWEDLSLADIDRPLNKRGKRDAPFMAAMCKSKGYVPDLLVSSNANRARSTAECFKREFGFAKEQFVLEASLYHAPEDMYVEVCFGLDEDVRSVMLFGHNPGITYLANSVGEKYIDNVPTSGVLVIDASIDQWNALDLSNCKLIDFIYPKMF